MGNVAFEEQDEVAFVLELVIYAFAFCIHASSERMLLAPGKNESNIHNVLMFIKQL